MQLSVIQSFSSHLQNSLKRAFQFAAEFGHEEITSAHLLYGLASERGSLSSELLTKSDFPVDLLKQELVRKYYAPYLAADAQEPAMRDNVITTLTKAVRTAQLYAHPYVGTEHVLACLLNLIDDDLKQLFETWQIDMHELERQLLAVLKSTSKFPDLTETLRELQTEQEEQAEEEPEFPVLETLAKELTTNEAADQFAPLVGRERELEQVQQILGRKQKNNPLLVGKAGVGKTAIVEGLARDILNGTAPDILQGKRVFLLELGNLVAGTMYRGEFEQRMKMLVEELRSHPEILLFIDEIHTLVGAGSTGQALDAANILKPALARGDIRCIGATTWDEFHKHLAQDQALSRRFQNVAVDEPDKETTREILSGVKAVFENHHAVRIPKDIVNTALDLSERYLTHTSWPDKAIDLLDDASAHVRLKTKQDPNVKKRDRLKQKISKLQKEKNKQLAKDQYAGAIELHKQLQTLLEQLDTLSQTTRKKKALTQNHLRRAVSRRTGINTERLNQKSKPLSKQVSAALNQQIIGQRDAIDSLTRALQHSYSPLKDPRKPLGAFLLTGPSGVGKTETAKILAKELFGSEDALLRFDMSEYTEKHSISKLIGAPAGYVGYQENGLLAKSVRERPLSIVLFDEIEKAHPDIFQILLQVLDEGKLTDNTGMAADFRQTLILMTTNLGLDRLHTNLGFGDEDTINYQRIRQEMGAEVKQFLRPEILNRLDDVLYYAPLDIAQRKAIIQQRIDALNTRLEGSVTLRLSENAITHIAKDRYDAKQGARSLELLVRDLVEIPLSEQLSRVKKGASVQAETSGDSIVIKTK